MKNQNWVLLERVRESLKAPSDVPPGLLNGLATRLEEAISSSSGEPLAALSRQLVQLVHDLLRVSPPEAAKASRAGAPPELAAAYLLGQVGFAQRMASQAADKRADAGFVAALKDAKFKPYVVALMRQDLTGRELHEECSEAEETVSRKLKILRELGIAEFRREGTSFVNFLTPAARAACEHLQIAVPAVASASITAGVRASPAQVIQAEGRQQHGKSIERSEVLVSSFQMLMAKRIDRLAPHMQHQETLSPYPSHESPRLEARQ